MKSPDIKRFIDIVAKTEKEVFTLTYESTLFVDMPKEKLLNYLNQSYANELCFEAKRKMKMFGITAAELLAVLDIGKEVFSMLMSGKLQSYKHIRTRVQFCELIDNQIKELCSK